jgi:hypothetical protein
MIGCGSLFRDCLSLVDVVVAAYIVSYPYMNTNDPQGSSQFPLPSFLPTRPLRETAFAEDNHHVDHH